MPGTEGIISAAIQFSSLAAGHEAFESRRLDLLDRKYLSGLSARETIELEVMQAMFRIYLGRYCPTSKPAIICETLHVEPENPPCR